MFGLGKKYTKRSDGKRWTKNQILDKITYELSTLDPILEGNTISFPSYKHMSIEFIATNGSDAQEIDMNGSIIFEVGGKYLTWVDLFSQCKQHYGERYRGLRLYRDEEWEGSKFQKECHEVIAPTIAVLLDPDTRFPYLEGEEVSFNGEVVPPPYIDPKISKHLSAMLRTVNK